MTGPARRVLVVFPSPPQGFDGGAQLRCIQVVRGLVAVGCRVRLVQFGPPAGGLAELADLGPAVELRWTRLARADDLLGGLLARVASRWTGRPRLARSAFRSPRVRRWFAGQVRGFDPDAVWLIYFQAHALVARLPAGRPVVVLDTLDLLTQHRANYSRACELLGGGAAAVPDDRLTETFYDDTRPDPEEFRLLDRFPEVVAISPAEAETIAAHTARPRVTYLPLTARLPEADGRHDGGPLAVLTFHPIILHCYLYLVRRVLPAVRRAAPGFRLRVVGVDADRFPPADGVDLVGYVADLDAELAAARFLLLPVFGMTGQQTRITQAMARGLPVVTLRRAAEAAGVRHGVNGLVADTADELAAHVVRLWADPDEARRLGQGARRTIETEFSDARLADTLRGLLERVPAGGPA